MRCGDVIRELAAPTGAVGPAALDDHLARCPQCASWAEANDRLGRIWEATRPPALGDAAWSRIWTGVVDALDSDEAAATARKTATAGHRFAQRRLPLVLAQAAALLIGVGLLLSARQGLFGPKPVTSLSPAVAIVPAPHPVINTPAPPALPAKSTDSPASQLSGETRSPIQIDQQQVVLISLDDRGPGVQVRQDLVLNDSANAVDPFYAMYNTVEALADTVQVAALQ